MGITKRNITISDARKTLGEEYKHLTDEQLQSILDFLYKMAQIEFDAYFNNPAEYLKQETKD